MTTKSEPNPSTRKSEDFPKTTTIPDGWVADSIMDAYNRNFPQEPASEKSRDDDQTVPTTGRSSSETESTAEDSLFSRRLEPFPSTSELTGLYL